MGQILPVFALETMLSHIYASKMISLHATSPFLLFHFWFVRCDETVVVMNLLADGGG